VLPISPYCTETKFSLVKTNDVTFHCVCVVALQLSARLAGLPITEIGTVPFVVFVNTTDMDSEAVIYSIVSVGWSKDFAGTFTSLPK
jgi:hypothetical protein